MKTGEPKFRGCGVFMSMQPFKNLTEGDTCWDADAGNLMWNGSEWVSNNQKYAELYDKTLNNK